MNDLTWTNNPIFEEGLYLRLDKRGDRISVHRVSRCGGKTLKIYWGWSGKKSYRPLHLLNQQLLKYKWLGPIALPNKDIIDLTKGKEFNWLKTKYCRNCGVKLTDKAIDEFCTRDCRETIKAQHIEEHTKYCPHCGMILISNPKKGQCNGKCFAWYYEKNKYRMKTKEELMQEYMSKAVMIPIELHDFKKEPEYEKSEWSRILGPSPVERYIIGCDPATGSDKTATVITCTKCGHSSLDESEALAHQCILKEEWPSILYTCNLYGKGDKRSGCDKLRFQGEAEACKPCFYKIDVELKT